MTGTPARHWNVLVFPGGTEIALEIRAALSTSRHVHVSAAGMPVSSHTDCVFRRHYDVPGVHESGWIEALNAILDQEAVDFIFPAHDDAMVALARHAGELKARVVGSPLETCLLTRSKSKTYELFRNLLPVPSLYADPAKIEDYPVFLKPDRGQGSQDTHFVANAEELAGLRTPRPDHLILEWLPGEEYTIDCFSDREKGLLFCGGRERVRTRSGIAMHSRPFDSPIFAEYAGIISSKLALHGAWFFQLKKDRRGAYKLLEIAPRIAGTMALHRVLGVNFPLLCLYERERIPVEIRVNSMCVEIDRALTSRYRHNLRYGAVYVDLDDTLILDGKVNTGLVRYLYQCINRRIRIVLLTRHDGNLDETLARHRLSGLFDRVVRVPAGESKAAWIGERDAILIDDSFRERAAVSAERGIPTFDCSMFEMLLDERS